MNNKVIAFILARMGSSRFPGKVLADLNGKSVLQHVIDGVKMAKTVDDIVIVTTKTNTGDNLPIIDLAEKEGVKYSYEYGPSALDEFMKASRKFPAEIIVRVTADAPLVSHEAIDRLVKHLRETGGDYTHNRHKYGVPHGFHAEAVRADAMEKVYQLVEEDEHKQHITLFILQNPNLFKIENFPEDKEIQMPNVVLSIDRPEELERVKKIFVDLGEDIHNLKKAVEYLKSKPEFKEDEIDYHMDYMDVIHGEM